MSQTPGSELKSLTPEACTCGSVDFRVFIARDYTGRPAGFRFIACRGCGVREYVLTSDPEVDWSGLWTRNLRDG